jgi:hypothetical protein
MVHATAAMSAVACSPDRGEGHEQITTLVLAP